MTVLYILLGLLGLLVLLVLLALFVPVYARIRYDGQLWISIRVLGIPFTLLPTAADKKPKKKKKDKKSKKTKSGLSKGAALKKELSASFRRDGVAATLRYLQEVAAAAARALDKTLRAITVDRLCLEMLVAADEPSKTAVRYGEVCGVLYPALTTLESRVTFRQRHLRVEPGFLAEKSDVYLDVRLHVWVFRVVGAGLGLLLRLMSDKEVTDNG